MLLAEVARTIPVESQRCYHVKFTTHSIRVNEFNVAASPKFNILAIMPCARNSILTLGIFITGTGQSYCRQQVQGQDNVKTFHFTLKFGGNNKYSESRAASIRIYSQKMPEPHPICYK